MRIDLKSFRQSHRLYQSDMAELLEINQSNVSRAELRGYIDLTFPQKEKLFERFGRENVESFVVNASTNSAPVSIVATGNQNVGEGTQNNGYFGTDISAMNVIRQQSEALTHLADKQAMQTDRLIALLEKLSEKL